MKFQLIHADVLHGLRQLADESVQCVVTSPPYWGLRDYGIEPSVWGGGDAMCEHAFSTESIGTEVGRGNWAQGVNGRGEEQEGGVDAKRNPIRAEASRGFCEKCNAWLGCHGLEPTVDLYVAHEVLIFREVRRVLRRDGTLWLNLGDSYAVSGCAGNPPESTHQKQRTNRGSQGATGIRADRRFTASIASNKGTGGLKAKDLCGVPWAVAFALRADGWYLRADIVWHKPNPMPESVTDRPTKAHEYLFLLSKNAKYRYDADAIREPAAYLQPNAPDAIKSPYGQGYTRRADAGPGISGWARGEGSHDPVSHNRAGRAKGTPRPKGNAKSFRGGGAYTQGRCFDNDATIERDSHGNEPNESLTRNRRSVWTVATAPFPEAHFATFPPDLVEPCVLAGSSIGDTILDPFNGAGTTGVVALSHQRNYVGIERNADYVEMSRRRLRSVAPLFQEEVNHG